MVRKIISYTIDVLLIAFIAFVAIAQIQMVSSRNDPANYGVPRAFGKSFLYVATESMNDPDNPDCMKAGTGIIIDKVEITDLVVSTPILDEDGNVVDYQKDGDVVTFYYAEKQIVDTHRVVEIIHDEDNSTYTVYTMGDNPEAHSRFTREKWDSKYLIGKVVYHSQWLGDFLSISSPDAAAHAGKTAWFFPVAIIVPILLLAIIYMIEPIKQYIKDRKKRNKLIQEALDASGIDQNDEKAVELFKMKEEMRLDYLEEYEETKTKYKKQLEAAKKAEDKKKKKNGKK